MKTFQALFVSLFVVIVALELWAGYTGELGLEYVAKPLIMPWIAAYFLIFSNKRTRRIPILFAFFFCWLGDIFLMVAHQNESLFFAGVGAFLAGHLFYITVFFRSGSKLKKGLIQEKPLILLPFVIYFAVILWVLFPVLDGVMKPVISLYGLILVAMAVGATNRFKRVNHRSARLVFWGSLFFVFSDSVIAINKFHTTLENATILIMSTYILAQVLIMFGLLREGVK